MLQAGQRSRKSTWLPRARSIVSTGHPPGPRLTLVSLGALQVTGCHPETLLGTFHRQHLWKVKLILPTAPRPSVDRQGFCPLPLHGHRAALQGPPSIHSCPAQGNGAPQTQIPHPEGMGGGGIRRGSLGLTRWPALHDVVSVSWSL